MTRYDGNWNDKGQTVAAVESYRDGKPLLTRFGGRWGYVRTYVDSFNNLNDAAAKWCDTRNYFIAVKAGIGLGRALDCSARGCPVPRDEEEQRELGGFGYGPYN